MANVKWYAIYEKATGRLHSTASIDLDDPDTAIDEETGRPYSKSGLRGISHPAVTAGTHEYRKDMGIKPDSEDELRFPEMEMKVAPRRGGPIDRGFEVVELAIDPRLAPDDDPDGRQEWDEAKRAMVVVAGSVMRLRRLSSLRAQEDRLLADMARRGESPGGR